jgi:multiple antibiotic resistance protein
LKYKRIKIDVQVMILKSYKSTKNYMQGVKAFCNCDTLRMIDLLFIPDDFVQHVLRSTIALLVILNPVGIVPMYIALTQKMESTKRTQLSKTVIITSSALLFAFAIAGSLIFAVFGITLSSFMIAGGVLLFIVAIELLTGGGWRFVGGSGVSEETGVVPIAFPLLAGPGAITAVIISFESSGLIVTAFSISIAIATAYVILRCADRIHRVLGKRGSLIVTRVFAVLIAAIAIEYIVDGVKALF